CSSDLGLRLRPARRPGGTGPGPAPGRAPGRKGGNPGRGRVRPSARGLGGRGPAARPPPPLWPERRPDGLERPWPPPLPAPELLAPVGPVGADRAGWPAPRALQPEPPKHEPGPAPVPVPPLGGRARPAALPYPPARPAPGPG